MNHDIVDQGDAKKYWTQIPNIVFDIGLNPYEMILYAHMKRAAGKDGICRKSTRTLAKECRMSPTVVVKAKAGLAKPRAELKRKPLIRVTKMQNPHGGKEYDQVLIVDIWRDNTNRFAPPEDENQVPDIALEGKTQVPDMELDYSEQVPREAQPSTIEHVKQVPVVVHKKNLREEDNKKVGAGAQTNHGVSLFRDITGHYPSREVVGIVVTHLGECWDDTVARECWREWVERGYNPRSIKWLTEWYAHGGPTPRNGHTPNGHKPKVELDPFGEPWIPKPFTAEDAILRSPGKNPDDVRANFEGRLEWKDVRCL